MTELIHGLVKMFLELEVVGPSDNAMYVLVFAVGCGIVGLLAVALDASLFFLQGRSLLNLRHGRQTVLFLFVWAFGAFLIGWLGQLVNIFLVSLSACVVVGFSWPVLFTKILKKVDESSNDEPEQPIIEES